MDATNNVSEPAANPGRGVERDVAMFHFVVTLALLAYSLLVGMERPMLQFLSATATLACLIGIVGAVYAFRGRRDGLKMMLCADLGMTVLSIVFFTMACARSMQPLPPLRYCTDDGPWLEATARQIALWVSGGAVAAAVTLLISAILTIRRLAAR